MNIEEPSKHGPPQESVKGGSHTAEHDGQTYDVYKLVHLSESLLEEVVPIDSLEENRNSNCWHDKEGNWVGPHHLISASEKYQGHSDWDKMKQEHPTWEDIIEKVRNADYKTHPILIIGEGTVIDGMNRLTKAWIEGADEVKVKKFDKLPEEAILSEERLRELS